MGHGGARLRYPIDRQGQPYLRAAEPLPRQQNPTRRTIAEVGAIGLAEAREKARQWIALIGKGVDPAIEVERQRLAEQRKQADTFGVIAETFFTRKLKAQRRGFVVEQTVRRELLPHWGTRPVTDITHRDIRELVQKVAERAPTGAHNVLDAVNAVFNFAAAQDAIEVNPARLLRRNAILAPKKHRQRVLGDTSCGRSGAHRVGLIIPSARSSACCC